MNVLLGHASFDWIMAGIVVFIGLMIVAVRFIKGQYVHVALSICVWVLVYSLHAGSTAGIMTATFAALLFDTIGLYILAFFWKRRG